ncbi:VOC family protein [Amycolatopsis nigrescens]|uniref:VOC family protein n=1 Tax=Amycolatopsis nigrescens TaxID=381445 RepID=UPI000377F7C7|nr:VOC family protein [Amycolatopsis nigrescens]
MTVQLDHTIIASRDREASASFYARLFGFADPKPYGPFLTLQTGNGVNLDFLATDGEIASQHYAFLVSESEFDEIFGRIREQGLQFWADPHRERPGEINTNDGGRGTYFHDPSGHALEIITRTYGSGGE